MKFLGNIIDPQKTSSWFPLVKQSGKTQEEAVRDRALWLQDKIIGEPQATAVLSVEELKSFGMVGVYEAD